MGNAFSHPTGRGHGPTDQGRQEKKGTGKGKGTKIKRDASTGRFTPKHGTYMVTSASQGLETATPAQLWGQSGLQNPALLPLIPDPQADIFADGMNESVTFAWPASAGPALAHHAIYSPGKVPPIWERCFQGPQVKHHQCKIVSLVS